ncbi:site-specific DNA-cytosine methylase [Variovorax paradoxus]|uniref:DNA cytosine methyltransferase n=1 Tax=Variovorax atrisoli TaxID=3394203 RepID=UPI00119A0FA6|nr:DNA cytosine methyltransferase [Variovorax paradoxus]MDR6521807.1 site-specific DNA-cytosine methylase [Variovorax paradoxus]
MKAVEIRHFHAFVGLGGGARGFNKANPRVGNLQAKFRCIGGIDVDAAAIRDFNRLANATGTVLDLFDRSQFEAFHGRPPPAGWTEAMPADIHRAAGYERPHIVFLSAPCKGFSGLLSEGKSKTDKYQALNRLTLRGVWLMLEAWKDDPPELFVFENVPRIATRGRHLLDQIVDLLRSYGYAVAETTHDCGELGGLAQSRKRFLLVARHIEKVPPFLYEPEKRPLRAVGDVLGKMLMPGDLRAGPMHRVPSLQWKTWVRLAFVEAGSDWRSLNKLAVENGHLRDYLIVPDMHNGALGVREWSEPSGVVAGASRPHDGSFSVADPRQQLYAAGYGVTEWDVPSGAVAGESLPSNGKFAVADPRAPAAAAQYQQYGVLDWAEPMGAVIGVKSPGQGTFSVADPRGPQDRKPFAKYAVTEWDASTGTVIGGDDSGAYAVQDPRAGGVRHNNVFRVVQWNKPGTTVTAGTGPSAGGTAVADPRPDWHGRHGHLHVADWEHASRTVTAGGKGVQGGYLSVADPRSGIARDKGDAYLTAGHYGVIPWNETAGAVSAAACHDNGRWSVADPRPMPAPADKVVCRIQALDGTWHRPFTTLELAALQSLFDPEERFELDGLSDQAWRERIGNAVPSDAACAIAEVMGTTLLLAMSGETFMLSAQPIWVRDVAMALAMPGTV